ncbi:MAG: SDR family oxidoreductase [Azospirillaceae bacterium]
MADQQFAGRIALVTGGTQGVGAATARLLAQRGAEAVAICGRRAEAGERVAADLRQAGSRALFVEADLSRVADGLAVVDRVVEAFGGLDIVANVAGVTDRGTIDDTDPATFDRLFAVNTRAPFFVMQRALPAMRARGGGAIVNVASIAAHGGASYICAYVGAKAALAAITKNVAHTVRRDRVRVNCLNMGWTATEGEDAVRRGWHAMGENWLAEVEAAQPFGRLLRPDDVARAIAFLASDESGIATGSVIDFDQLVVGCYE